MGSSRKPSEASPGPEVRAAGGVVVRPGADGPEVALVHRPRYDDWTLPKGKLLEGEPDETGALREVEEETGLRCRLVRYLGEERYQDHHGRDKVVRYWLMRPIGGSFQPNDEVDRTEWLSFPDAVGRLTYPRDRALVRSVGQSTNL